MEGHTVPLLSFRGSIKAMFRLSLRAEVMRDEYVIYVCIYVNLNANTIFVYNLSAFVFHITYHFTYHLPIILPIIYL